MEELDKSKIAEQTRLVVIKIGDVIRKKRNDLGLTQQSLSYLMNSDKSLISEIERGAYKNITVCTLLKISKVLNISIKDFFD